MNLNKVILAGNATKEPELRKTPSGHSIVDFTLVTHIKWESGEVVTFHKIVAFGHLAEFCGKYIKKGTQVLVEGRLQTRAWGEPIKYRTEIMAENVQLTK